jgi:hypothetical protein
VTIETLLFVCVVVCVSTSFALQTWLMLQYRRSYLMARRYTATRPWAWLAMTKTGDVMVRYFGGAIIVLSAIALRYPMPANNLILVKESVLAAFAFLLVVQTTRNVRAELRSQHQSREEVAAP